MTTPANDATAPPTGAYAQVNGLEMYYEVHGSGSPLVLLHGGVLTIDLSFGVLLPALSKTHQVIAVELQGHGHTADCDREITLPSLAGDVVALLDLLGIDRADLFGFSLGGLVALQTALSHPARVDRMILASTHYRPDGYFDEIRDPEAFGRSKRLPTEDDFQEMADAYARVAPDPEHFQAFLAKCSDAVGAFEGWSASELRQLAAPTLLLIGDTDFVRIEHSAEMQRLIPDARLAVLPGTTHMGVTQRASLILPMAEDFLTR